MAFQPPVSVKDVLLAIHKREYLLPAIQREFVWDADQIRRLVDSLMRGYPIGSFLLWKVSAATAQDYTFYDFLTDYHERDHPFADKATVPSGEGVTAVLDGQQRLTALNIAMYGSHAEKLKHAWWTSTNAFPKKYLYLNLVEDLPDEELGLGFGLRFLTEAEARPAEGEPNAWYKVGAVLDLANGGPAMTKEIAARGITDVAQAHERLYTLWEAFTVKQPINAYLVEDDDPNKVLEIFVRVNSGGTTLSYSDLLLSMATNQWQDLDAREEVRSLVQELNTGGTRQFNFSKDLVLKTALMIAGVSLQFRVSNFTQANMLKVEQTWPATEAALLRAAMLLHQFGFVARWLTADSVIIPVAYYLHRRGVGDSYLDSTADGPDRETVRRWVVRSLMKRGVWGSGLDTLLARLRNTIDANTQPRFPVEALETEMSAVGKSLAFEDAEIDELLKLKYGQARTFAVLACLYPGLDFSKEFHEDHIFPKSLFTSSRLVAHGVPPERVDAFKELVNDLPNLQLLAGTRNQEKLATLPALWLAEAFDDQQRRTYEDANDLGGLPLDMPDFLTFFEDRSQRMRQRLHDVLGVQASQEV